MNWMMKVSIGMLLMAILLVSLGMTMMRANESQFEVTKVTNPANSTKLDAPKINQKVTPIAIGKEINLDEKSKLTQ